MANTVISHKTIDKVKKNFNSGEKVNHLNVLNIYQQLKASGDNIRAFSDLIADLDEIVNK
jgi:hypothetical protein